MTDFPRGWTLYSSVNGAGTRATITVPSVIGVVHVLDSFEARLLAIGATALYAPSITVSTGGATVLSWQLAVEGVASSVTSDDLSLSGLDIASPGGGFVIVQFDTNAIANVIQNLVIQGHDV